MDETNVDILCVQESKIPSNIFTTKITIVLLAPIWRVEQSPSKTSQKQKPNHKNQTQIQKSQNPVY